ncbi:hypothetical protein [Gimesia sp.]|uniref:hypothetical protein n=1 Tax=Gimesia sp. TaxID=2024833 RepID=UPI0025BEA71C|nr:hypothetical protein [Gimesia sp.]
MNSNNNNEMTNSLFDAFIAPSGMFTCNSAPYLFSNENNPTENEDEGSIKTDLLYYNPMPFSVDHIVLDEVPISDEHSFLAEYKGAEKHKICDRSALDNYTLTLVRDLAPSLLRCKHDVILFPLRGCRQPGIITKVVTGIPEEHIVIFNYTYATSQSQQNLILKRLSESLIQKIAGRESTSIGIVDTAKGGYGSKHLAEILESLHEHFFANQSWSVQFHLLHEQKRVPELSRQIPKYGNSNSKLMMLTPLYYGVDDLILEDWSEGIGLSCHWQGEHFELKRCIEPGKVLLRNSESIQVIESNSLSETMTYMFVESVNQQMIGNEDFIFLQDVLAEGVNGRLGDF